MFHLVSVPKISPLNRRCHVSSWHGMGMGIGARSLAMPHSVWSGPPSRPPEVRIDFFHKKPGRVGPKLDGWYSLRSRWQIGDPPNPMLSPWADVRTCLNLCLGNLYARLHQSWQALQGAHHQRCTGPLRGWAMLPGKVARHSHGLGQVATGTVNADNSVAYGEYLTAARCLESIISD